MRMTVAPSPRSPAPKRRHPTPIDSRGARSTLPFAMIGLMRVAGTVTWPRWSDSESGTYAGLYPLSVERHVQDTADRLVPGITTVTANARYYATPTGIARDSDVANHYRIRYSSLKLDERAQPAVQAATLIGLDLSAAGRPLGEGARRLFGTMSQSGHSGLRAK